MRLYIFITALLLIAFCPKSVCHADNGSIDEKLVKLDKCLKNKSAYDNSKEQRIQKLKDALKKAATAKTKYNACIKLYDEYKSYQYDSAYTYANRSLELATKLNDDNYKVESECAMVFCLVSAGLYKEAFDKMGGVNAKNATAEYKKIYYTIAARLNYDISDYNHAEPYHMAYLKRGSCYTDSLLAILKPNTTEWMYAVGQQQMKEYKYDESRGTFMAMLKKGGFDMHTGAIVTSCIGWMAWKNHEEENAIEYLADAATYDVMSSTKETTALRGLAELLYKHGDMQRAISYIQHSLDDANFYGARQRKIEVGEILPIIETNRYNILKEKSNVLIGGIIIISVLVVVILFTVVNLYRQKRNLQEARNAIRKNNEDIKHAYTQLQEANNIKNEYIGNSFYINSEFIDKMEKLYRMIDRKIQARQYDDLRYSLKESVLNKERDNMFAVFDSTFLKIFPNFVEQYNSMFPENERKIPEKKMSLTTEMRIFALIRLGITESERIAKFLKYSVHTINTYKTRVKNKSLVENDDFEASIMRIS